jgi:tRNA pseudouridine38-40 synthase
MAVTNWKLTLEYDGTRYSGWQEQRNARTIQGELRRAASQIISGELDIQGAGRTDAGVHALAQVAHLRSPHPARCSGEELVRRLNTLLPADIVVLQAERVHSSFHARHDALLRRYMYQISTRKTAFHKRHVWWVQEPLDVAAMSRGARMLIGRHNFEQFRAQDGSRPQESPIVVVEDALVEAQKDLILFHIEASHFLWRMVRRLTGVLVKIGLGEMEVEQLTELLKGRRDPAADIAAWTAPASGLFLAAVRYERSHHMPEKKSHPADFSAI